MNSTSNFQEVRSSPSRSPSYIASCTINGINPENVPGVFYTHNLMAFSTVISAEREKAPDTFLMRPDQHTTTLPAVETKEPYASTRTGYCEILIRRIASAHSLPNGT